MARKTRTSVSKGDASFRSKSVIKSKKSVSSLHEALNKASRRHDDGTKSEKSKHSFFRKHGEYVHFWYRDSEQRANIDGFINESLRSIRAKQLSDYKDTLEARNRAATTSNNAEDIATASQIIENTLNDEGALQRVLDKAAKDATSMSYGRDINTTKMAVSARNIIDSAEDVSKSVDALNSNLQLIESLLQYLPNADTQDAKDFMDEYENALIEEAKAGGEDIGEVAKRHLFKVVGEKQDCFVNVNPGAKRNSLSSGHSVKNYTKKIIMYLDNLRLMSKAGTVITATDTMGVTRNSETKDYIGPGTILKRIQDSIVRTASYATKSATEALAGYATVEALRMASEAINSVEKDINFTVTPKSLSGKGQSAGYSTYVSAKLEKSSKLYDDYKHLNEPGLMLKAKKADAEITVTKGKATITFGLNVKNLGSTVDFNSGKVQKATIKMQEGSPLYKLLVEMGLGDDVGYGIVNLAAGHYDRAAPGPSPYRKALWKSNGSSPVESDASLNAAWNKLMESVQKRALLTALTGFCKENVNGFVLSDKSGNLRLYNISHVISRILADDIYGSSASVKISQIAGKKSRGQAGLSRITYRNMNKYVGSGYDINAATDRSYNVYHAIKQRMYDTKVRIDLTIKDINMVLGTM